MMKVNNLNILLMELIFLIFRVLAVQKYNWKRRKTRGGRFHKHFQVTFKVFVGQFFQLLTNPTEEH